MSDNKDFKCNEQECNDSECNDSCCQFDDCGCSDLDSDSEEYHNFVDKINNEFLLFQQLYKQYCIQNNREPNDMEMMAFIDILKGGTGKLVCLAGEEDIKEEDKKFVMSLDEFNKEQQNKKNE